MKITKIQKGLVLATIAAGLFAAGCELIVDFDRTRIPVPLADAATTDANVADTSTADTGADAATDAETDAGGELTDSGTDAADAADQ